MTIHQTGLRSSITPAEQRFIDLYGSVSEQLPGAENPLVRAWREAALDQFIARGLPHRRVEEWKYTDLRVLMPDVRPLVKHAKAADVSIEAAIGKSLAAVDAYRAVFVDGFFRPDLSTVQMTDGVTFQPLRAVLEDRRATEEALAKLPLAAGDSIASLSAVFATDGTVLTVAAHAKIEKPIHLIFITGETEPHLSSTQNAISIGEHAEVSLIETHAAGEQSQAFCLTRLEIGAHAVVKHIRSNGGQGSKHLSTAIVKLGAGTQYDPLQMTSNGALTRAQVNVRFEGEGARCHYTGAMMLRGQSHGDFTLVVDHAAPACESRELVKAVLDGRSRGVFQGKVIVQRGAQQTDGKQMANALLLSDEAEFDSKPELEIYADDVACGHGATAGQLDDELMFYLRARGIPEPQAKALLISAFIGEALSKIENEALREALQEKVDAWLS